MKLFKAFRLDPENHILWRDGDRVRIAPKSFDVLAYLIGNAGRVVTQDEILEALWLRLTSNWRFSASTFLKSAGPWAIGLKTRNSFETLPKRGYRFIAAVVDEHAANSDLPASQPTVDATDAPGTSTLEYYPAKHWPWKLAITAALLAAAGAAIAIYYRPRGSQPNTSLNAASVGVLEAQYFIARGQNKEDLKKALTYANTAIKLDERYAPGWAVRAIVENSMAEVGIVDMDEGFRNARKDAERAIALDPTVATAYLSLARTQVNHDWDWPLPKHRLPKQTS
jgi:DNA-binding winged helix-turn-helix (wHTH) protein